MRGLTLGCTLAQASSVKEEQRSLQHLLRDLGALDLALEQSHRVHAGIVDKKTFDQIFRVCTQDFKVRATQVSSSLLSRH